MDAGQCSTQDDVPQSMAFTVTFDTAKSSNNKFVKRHSRNLSLPVVKVYENNVMPEATINGKTKKAGNHSEGYFSSDPEDDGNIRHHSKMTNTLVTVEASPSEEAPTDMALGDNNEGSDVGSETGTYTIDKEIPEVVTARLSIDASFGVDQSVNNKHDSSTWVSEWASSTLNHKNSYNDTNACVIVQPAPKTLKTKMVSKIPSPMTTRARLGSRTKLTNNAPPIKAVDLTVPKTKDLVNESTFETESYLKTTEKCMTAIAARMSLSLDSGGESDADSKGGKKILQRSDSSASESGPKTQIPSVNRYNRAVSLRRGRLDEETKKVESSISTRTIVKTEVPQRSASSVRSKPATPVLPPPTGLTRTDNVRLSMRSKLSPQSPLLSGPKSEMNVKKKSTGGGRSNSTLSSKEVEFQNWKRRKNYDPMKAAAEGKKKEIAAKKSPVNSLTQSTNNAIGSAPKSPVTSVLRSASFHGTRQLAGPSSSEDEEEITLSAEDEDWPTLQAPKTSLENTPRGSHVSLYSNNSNSPRAKHKLEGVDNLVVSAISNLSSKLKVNASSLLKKLRYLYDEESEKYKSLTLELEQLEIPENSGSPQKSSSRELAFTLKNLKRMDITLKVLNDVLFDNVDYE